MNRITRIYLGLLDCFDARHKAAPDIRLQVSNLTRHTVLATCMEVADKGQKRRKGLLGRERLSPGEGMWILPCEAVHTFGMRFPIDLVYLDRKNRIKKLRSHVPPWRLSACFSAHSVLELASGTILSTKTSPGDRIEISSALSYDNSEGGLSTLD
jgi:uncharacterized membrane protein (UPF0127 family)